MQHTTHSKLKRRRSLAKKSAKTKGKKLTAKLDVLNKKGLDVGHMYGDLEKSGATDLGAMQCQLKQLLANMSVLAAHQKAQQLAEENRRNTEDADQEDEDEEEEDPEEENQLQEHVDSQEQEEQDDQDDFVEEETRARAQAKADLQKSRDLARARTQTKKDRAGTQLQEKKKSQFEKGVNEFNNRIATNSKAKKAKRKEPEEEEEGGEEEEEKKKEKKTTTKKANGAKRKEQEEGGEGGEEEEEEEEENKRRASPRKAKKASGGKAEKKEKKELPKCGTCDKTIRGKRGTIRLCAKCDKHFCSTTSCGKFSYTATNKLSVCKICTYISLQLYCMFTFFIFITFFVVFILFYSSFFVLGQDSVCVSCGKTVNPRTHWHKCFNCKERVEGPVGSDCSVTQEMVQNTQTHIRTHIQYTHTHTIKHQTNTFFIHITACKFRWATGLVLLFTQKMPD